jgi:N-ethylmaleimide reductase
MNRLVLLPMLNEFPLLQPRRLGDLLLSNRVVMAPLTRGRASNSGHVPNDLMRQYYEQRATAGLIISEGTWVSEDGQGWLGAPGIYNRQQGAGWEAITEAVHAKGGRIFAQLWHQGSVSHPSFFHDGRLPLAPSAIDPIQTVHVASGTTMTVTPREMARADIRQAIADYRSAAQIAKDAGFDGVQLQAGFVYLIQQFLHEPTNRRTDEYVYEKLNAYHLSHVFLMRQLADFSGSPIAALARDAVFHHFRKIYHGQLILNVGISREHATALIAAGLGDLVAFGREYIANPDLVERIRLHAPLNEQRPEGYYGATAWDIRIIRSSLPKFFRN